MRYIFLLKICTIWLFGAFRTTLDLGGFYWPKFWEVHEFGNMYFYFRKLNERKYFATSGFTYTHTSENSIHGKNLNRMSYHFVIKLGGVSPTGMKWLFPTRWIRSAWTLQCEVSGSSSPWTRSARNWYQWDYKVSKEQSW